MQLTTMERRRRGAFARARARTLRALSLALFAALALSCTLNPADGSRVAFASSAITFTGYSSAASSPVVLQALDSGGAWQDVGRASSGATNFNTAGATPLYEYSLVQVIPQAYWREVTNSAGKKEYTVTTRMRIGDLSTYTFTQSGKDCIFATLAAQTVTDLVAIGKQCTTGQTITITADARSVSIDLPPISFITPQYDINHIVSTGQSLSLGTKGVPESGKSYSYSAFSNVMFDKGMRSRTLSAFSTLAEGKPPGAGNGDILNETMSTAMADHISWQNQKSPPFSLDGPHPHKVLVTLGGVGGASYEELRGSAYQASLDQVRNAYDYTKNATGRTYAVRVVTVVHGEEDYKQSTLDSDGSKGDFDQASAKYLSNLIAWQKDFERDIKAITGQSGTIPLLHTQFSACTNYGEPTPESPITKAQLDAHIARPGKIILVGPKYQLAYSDAVHLTAEGYKHMGEYYAKVYRRVVLENGVWEPVRPREATRSGKVITVKFHVPVPPLKLETNSAVMTNPGDHGFQVVQGSSNQRLEITSVKAQNDVVTITLEKEPTSSDVRVRYAYSGTVGNGPGITSGPRGTLHDSDPTPSRYGKNLVNWAVHFEQKVN